MELNKITNDFDFFYEQIKKKCPPLEPRKNPVGGAPVIFSNLLIATLGCLWLLNGRCSQQELLNNVALAKGIKVPTQGCFSKRVRKLLKWLEKANERILKQELHKKSQVRLAVDSFAIDKYNKKTKNRKRKKRSKATFGYIPSQVVNFYGFRLHWLMTPSGAPFAIKLLPGNIHDKTAFRKLIKYLYNKRVFGDLGYICLEEQIELFETQNTILLTPKKKGVTNQIPEWILKRKKCVFVVVSKPPTAYLKKWG